jgi:hypothetical protein
MLATVKTCKETASAEQNFRWQRPVAFSYFPEITGPAFGSDHFASRVIEPDFARL